MAPRVEKGDKDKEDCCLSGRSSCCRVESIISVDERGQMVLPKDVRERAKIRAGDKLAVVSMRGQDGDICCIALIRAEEMEEMVKSILGPVINDLFKGQV